MYYEKKIGINSDSSILFVAVCYFSEYSFFGSGYG